MHVHLTTPIDVPLNILCTWKFFSFVYIQVENHFFEIKKECRDVSS